MDSNVETLTANRDVTMLLNTHHSAKVGPSKGGMFCPGKEMAKFLGCREDIEQRVELDCLRIR